MLAKIFNIQSSLELTLQEQTHKLTERHHRAVQRRRACATTAVATQPRPILTTTNIHAAAAIWLLPLHEALPRPPQEIVFVGLFLLIAKAHFFTPMHSAGRGIAAK
jgi:hypothetical protein